MAGDFLFITLTMRFTLQEIIVDNLIDFDINHILQCGQVFRFDNLGYNDYYVYSGDKRCRVVQGECTASILTNDIDYFHNYFDLDRDYQLIKQQLKGLPFMQQAIDNGYGIRILNQQKFETLISFIISANNHIPRIKSIISRICSRLGNNMGEYFAFPNPQQMAAVDEDFYTQIGAGYRAKYLATTARAVANGFDLQSLDNLDSASARKQLCALMGVGNKVADCILLFGYHKQDVFPVDTWIKKVYTDIVGDGCTNNNLVNKRLLEIYGSNSGYAQQYLFFNKRGM